MDMHNVFEATTPLNVKPNDPGILTLKQYHDLRNPDNKSHDSDAYVSDIYTLNFQFNMPTMRTTDRIPTRDNKWLIRYDQHRDGSPISVMRLSNREHEQGGDSIVAVYYEGKWLYQPKYVYLEDLQRSDKKGTYVQHKYPERYLELVLTDYVKDLNKTNNHKAFKRIKIGGEYLSFHKQKDYDSINVLNSDGLEVATASNEWGTTLIQVADEYKGKGIGAILGELFIDEYQLPSGGYTAAGYQNAKKIWSKRVGEYIKNGWYSEMVKANRMTVGEVKAILDDYKRVTKKQEKNPSNTPSASNEKEYLCYMDDGITFVLYDRKFLDEPDEQYIYGHTFLRSTDFESDVVYTFDYDDDYSRKLLSYILLQSQRNNGVGVNVDFEGSDMFEYDDLNHVRYEDGFVYLTKDIIDVDKIANIERKLRRSKDQYGEILNQLLELSETKYR